jgi:hypothetical protein
MRKFGKSASGRGEFRLPDESPRAMPQFASAFELLKPGETGLLIYTDGSNLKLHEDGTGESGWWHLDPKRPFHRAFIFKRSASALRPHELYSGRFTGFDGPDVKRFKLLLEDVRQEGTTRTNWTAFARTNQNPIRFLEGPEPLPEQIITSDSLPEGAVYNVDDQVLHHRVPAYEIEEVRDSLRGRVIRATDA